MTDLVWRRGAEQRSGVRLPAPQKFVSRWLRGAPEQTAARRSAAHHIELGAEWTVLAGADCGLAADYVIVGPGGIFVASTAIRPGKKVWADESVIWVNGRPTNHVNDVCSAALEASARLTVTTGEVVNVTPVVIVPSPVSLVFGGDPARRIAVVTAEGFTRWLMDGSRELTREAIAYFTMVAEERDTWSTAVTAA